MKLNKGLIKVFFWFFLLSFGFFLVFPFLSKTEIVDSEILVMEGWVNDHAIHQTVKEFNSKKYKYILTTGGPVTGNYFALVSNGFIKFDSINRFTTKNSIIEVVAGGSSVDNVFSHFVVSVNDTISIGGAFTTEEAKHYYFGIPEGLKIRSVSVFFDNDCTKNNEDRNFWLREIIIDGTAYPTLADGVTFNTFYKNQVISRPVYKSIAEKAKLHLIDKGISNEKILPVGTPPVEYDRTYESALAIKRYLEIHFPNEKDINIVSENVHSRRTWMMYRKALGADYNIGILSVEENGLNSSNWYKSKEGISKVGVQFVKYLYAQFYFYYFG